MLKCKNAALHVNMFVVVVELWAVEQENSIKKEQKYIFISASKRKEELTRSLSESLLVMFYFFLLLLLH